MQATCSWRACLTSTPLVDPLPSEPMAETSLATGPEWPLLLAACRPDRSKAVEEIGSLLQFPVRWETLFALAESHGVLPLLHQALMAVRDSVSPEALNKLASKYQTNLHKAMMLSRELIRILDSLAENEIEVMPYKGLALSESVYGDIALRQTGDIDLLIRAKDVSRARDVLRNLNFVPHLELSERQENAYFKSGYEFMFDAPAGRNLLELQWAVQPRFYAVDLSAEKLFERAIPVSVAGRIVKTPSFEDLFIVLSLHAAKHVWAKLIWIGDLARIMELDGLDWAEIESCARGLRIRRILALNLTLANQLLGVSIPLAAQPMLEAGIGDHAELIKGFVSGGAPFDVDSVGYFRFMLRLREDPIDRMRFITRLLLTPGPGEWASVHLPDSLFPAYRLVRLSRLAARLAHL
jgi:Uncharacterised nucleotidyltransferase